MLNLILYVAWAFERGHGVVTPAQAILLLVLLVILSTVGLRIAACLLVELVGELVCAARVALLLGWAFRLLKEGFHIRRRVELICLLVILHLLTLVD